MGAMVVLIFGYDQCRKREIEREKGEFCSVREVGRDTRIVVFSIGHVTTKQSKTKKGLKLITCLVLKPSILMCHSFFTDKP